MQTRVENGSLVCHRFGTITGIDCSCLRDTDCNGCFIFNSTKTNSNISEQSAVALGEALGFKLADSCIPLSSSQLQ